MDESYKTWGVVKMRIAIALLLALVIATTTWATPATLENRIATTMITSEIKAGEMTLEDFLIILTEKSGIQIIAVPEVAGMKIDLQVSASDSLEKVLAALRSKYSLVTQFNEVKQSVIVLQGVLQANLMYSGKAMPSQAPTVRESSPGRAAPALSYRPTVPFNTEEYKRLYDNSFQIALSTPVSTFSIDVDTASYSNVRRYINNGTLPPPDAVRTEELINYFSYDYPQPTEEHPFSLTTEVGDSPWSPGRKLVLIGLQGKNIRTENLPPSNLVFLIDVSGSMAQPNKLPLLKTAFKLLVKQLREQDSVAIVVYAGAAGLVMEPTPGNEKAKIIDKIDSLQAGGSTAGSEGLKLAYKVAKEKFVSSGNNRVILATDGDFNVGPSSEGDLTRLIEERRNDGIFLSVLGFGMGNIKDNKMEALADKGNGNYAYIDNALEAKKVMVGQMAGTLYTIAKDVKIQVEFNPSQVKSYRLIGYENRMLENRDFSDDKKDAGDMGAGHAVTAIYEIIPAGSPEAAGSVDPLIYQQSQVLPSDELMQVKIRYKNPAEESSQLYARRISSSDGQINLPSENFRFAAAVAEYAMLLRNSEFKGQSSYQQALALARGARGTDETGYRSEFIRLLEVSQFLGK